MGGFVAWSLVFALTAGGQQPLPLSEALRRAGEAHPDLVRSQATLEQAEASLLAARGAFDPNLGAALIASRSETAGFISGFPFRATTVEHFGETTFDGILPTGTSFALAAGMNRVESRTLAAFPGAPPEVIEQRYWTANVELALRQDLLAPFRRTSSVIAVRGALGVVDEAEAAQLDVRETALTSIADAWWAWWGAVERVAVAERALAAAEALHEQTVAWYQEGLAAGLDVSRTRASLLAAQRDLLRAAAEARRLRDALLVQIGEEPGAEVVPGEAPLPGPVFDPQEVAARARETNPQLQRARVVAANAEREARDARGALLPRVDALVEVGVASLAESAREAVAELFDPDEVLPTVRGGVEVGVPIGNRAARGELARLQSIARQQWREVELLEREVDAEVLAALDEVRTAQATVRLAEGSMQAAAEAEAAERARRDEGVGRLTDLLDAITDRVRAEVDLLDARIELFRARLSLARLEGRAEAWLGLEALGTFEAP